MKLYKREFIRRLAKKHRRYQAHYAKAIEEIFAGIKDHLANGNTLHFPGFGSFVTHSKKEQQLKFFRTGKLVRVPAHRYVVFHVGELLRKAVLKHGLQKRKKRRK